MLLVNPPLSGAVSVENGTNAVGITGAGLVKKFTEAFHQLPLHLGIRTNLMIVV